MPGRRTVAISPVKSTTVDSIPTSQGPPSRIIGIRSASCSATCLARVGETRFERLALGAASGKPHRLSTANITGCAGQRTATVSPPAVTMSGTKSALGRTIDNGPGQNTSARRSAALGQADTQLRAISADSTCTMSGLFAGRPLALKTRLTASGESALAANP